MPARARRPRRCCRRLGAGRLCSEHAAAGAGATTPPRPSIRSAGSTRRRPGGQSAGASCSDRPYRPGAARPHSSTRRISRVVCRAGQSAKTTREGGWDGAPSARPCHPDLRPNAVLTRCFCPRRNPGYLRQHTGRFLVTFRKLFRDSREIRPESREIWVDCRG